MQKDSPRMLLLKNPKPSTLLIKPLIMENQYELLSESELSPYSLGLCEKLIILYKQDLICLPADLALKYFL